MKRGMPGLIMLLLAGSAAGAAVHTTTVSRSSAGIVVMPLFDPALGSLLAVSAEATYDAFLPYYSAVTPIGFDHAVTGSATLGGLTFAINGATTTTGSGSGVFTVSARGTASWTSPTDFAVLIGGSSSSLYGYASASATAPGMPIPGNFVPQVSYKVSYTYDDAPAVPEPATWAMMVGGFILIGLALRAARRSRAIAGTSEA